MKHKIITLNKINISNDNPMVLIAGPCILTDYNEAYKIASFCKRIADKYKINYIFKASYDKANRTNIKSYRGPGITKGLNILKEIKNKLKIGILTDVHNLSEIDDAASVADIIQIPAFLSRQTDLIIETAKTKKIINIKKGQFLAPDDMKNIAEKILSTGNNKIIFTERGTSFGYHNLVVDMRGIEKMKELGYPVIFDATHSVQLPSAGNISGGERAYILPLAKASVAIGISGIFMEVHPDPKKSLSDSASIFPMNKLDETLKILKKIDEVVKNKY
jgi:2-dehydro-3-deoxyphosphooctonate aldolase (KDO 8-P synthase)